MSRLTTEPRQRRKDGHPTTVEVNICLWVVHKSAGPSLFYFWTAHINHITTPPALTPCKASSIPPVLPWGKCPVIRSPCTQWWSSLVYLQMKKNTITVCHKNNNRQEIYERKSIENIAEHACGLPGLILCYFYFIHSLISKHLSFWVGCKKDWFTSTFELLTLEMKLVRELFVHVQYKYKVQDSAVLCTVFFHTCNCLLKFWLLFVLFFCLIYILICGSKLINQLIDRLIDRLINDK